MTPTFDSSSPTPERAGVTPAERSAVVSVEAHPRVFVVTPSFEQARYLRATIDSVLAQDYPRLDYFVADAGSTDGSVDILRSYGERVRWVSHPDGGQAAAISAAWQSSDADIVAWLNSDDLYLPGAVSRIVEHFGRHPGAGMAYGNAWFIDENGERLRPYPTRPFDADKLRTECFICQPAAFLRRAVFERIALPDPRLRYCMDYDLWLRLSREFPISHFEQYVACSRLHAETKSRRELDGVFTEIVQVTARHFGTTPRNWAVAAMIHRSKSRVERFFGFLPRQARNRLQSLLVQRLEARYRGPLYSDGWAGTETLVEVRPDAEGRVRLRALSPFWPEGQPLGITIEHDGRILAERTVDARGIFFLEFEPPAAVETESKATPVLLRANRTFVPIVERFPMLDERPLSFMVSDSAGYNRGIGDLLVTLEQKERLGFFFHDYVETSSRILELGGADGWLGDYLRNFGFHGYQRLDPKGPAGTEGWWSPNDILGDIRDWRSLGIAPGSFDFIIAFDVLQQVDCLSECFDLLAPGGHLLVIAPTPGREWLARLLAKLHLRRGPVMPSSRSVDFRDLRGFRVVTRRTQRFLERWAVLRKPLEAGS